VQLITSRKETKDASKARQTLSETLAFYLKDQGAVAEQYRQEITVMRMKLNDREAELRTLQIQHNTLVGQILRDHGEQFMQTLQDHQERLRHQHGQQELAERQRVPDLTQSPVSNAWDSLKRHVGDLKLGKSV
jgi:phosphoenolpyruvate carboxylase